MSKKNRFYYSKKQSKIDEEIWNMPTRFTFVKTPDGWKQYSGWYSVKSAKCNWEDAKLVYETDDEPEVIIHECIPELIADLEAKLAEKEKAHMEAMQNAFNDFLTLRQELNQDKISFAVEKLEKVKTRIQEDFNYDDLMYWLNNQIKQLKQGK